ncbi:MAG: hypothetical protein GY697_13840 [Desulfobacterales bacterium]|nr:hypothetical protein [Desulfobacterales bacterium]
MPLEAAFRYCLQSGIKKKLQTFLSLVLIISACGAKQVSAHPQTASFGPERRFRSFEFLDIARYACGFKIAQALLWTKIYHLWTDTS